MEQNSGITIEGMAVTAPGLVGEISNWISGTAMKCQPALSLAAALALVASCKAHVVRAPSGLRTNLYLCGIAPSGAGKNYPIDCVKRILKSINLSGLLSGKPGSGAALTELVMENGGRRLVVWDEFGYGFSGIKDSGNTHEKEVIPVLLEMFSSANSTFLPKRIIGDRQHGPRPEIDQPCLNVLGFTAPDKLFSSFNLAHAIDGFLARFLFVQVATGDVELREQEVRDIPYSIQCGLKHWLNFRGQGDVERYFASSANAICLPFTPDAKIALVKWRDFFDEEKSRDGLDDVAFDALWARALEHTIKVSLTVASGRVITEVEFNWAAQFVTICILDFIASLKRFCGSSEREKNGKKVLAIVEKFQPIAHRDLTRKTQFLKNSERNEIIDSLVEAGQLRKELSGDRANSFVYLLSYEQL